MHDWTLVSLKLDWKTGQVTLDLRNPTSDHVSLIATDVSSLQVPRMAEWGPSVSVNSVSGPTNLEDGRQHLTIEMQSGDIIAITARLFKMPAKLQEALYPPV